MLWQEGTWRSPRHCHRMDSNRYCLRLIPSVRSWKSSIRIYMLIERPILGWQWTRENCVYTYIKRLAWTSSYCRGVDAVYCDLKRYLKTVSVSPRFTVAIGCHTEVTQLTPEREHHLQHLLLHPRIVPGEIGLVWTEPMHSWDLQLSVCRRLVSSSCTRRPLVFHLWSGRQHHYGFWACEEGLCVLPTHPHSLLLATVFKVNINNSMVGVMTHC